MLASPRSPGVVERTPVFRKLVLFFVAITLVASSDRHVFAQFDFQVVPSLSNLNSGPPPHNLEFKSRVRIQPNANVGLLEITATMDPSWHLYSLTQPAGGPLKSQIKLQPSKQYRLLGSFAPDHPPKQHYIDVFKMDAEEFSGTVTWSAPIKLLAPASELKVGGYVEGQVCADGGACVPFDASDSQFEATVDGGLSREETMTLAGGRVDGTHTSLRTWLSHSQAKPGDTIQLFVGFTPDSDWHVYAYSEQRTPFQQPTLIHTTLPNGWNTAAAKSNSQVISEEGPLDDVVRYYEGPTTIAVPIKIPANAKAGNYPLSGNIAFQTCSKSCDFPTAVSWRTTLTVGNQSGTQLGIVTIDPTPTEYEAVAELVGAANDSSKSAPANKPTQVDEAIQIDKANSGLHGNSQASTSASLLAQATTTAGAASSSTDAAPSTGATNIQDIQFETQNPAESTPLIKILLSAFAGGFILNFMPCVLPVIGLKILSFVSQAGSDRVKVFNLNLWYSLGMLAVFWVLAVLAAAPVLGLSENGFGWGQQFNYQGFAIPLVCVVFVMALSFLGVWEIPIPGFATSDTASELSQKEGLSGAFFKGVITTILATPCSAPGLIAAYGFAVNSKSVSMPFLIFTVMGLGMAMPYLVIGAFPSLIRFLPKPGEWMETFKQIMGFVLLGTVIFLMQNVSLENLLPTVALLFGLWFACWWVGSLSESAPVDQTWRARGIAIVISLLAAVISFGGQVDAFDMSFSSLRGKAQRDIRLMVDRQIAVAGASPTGGTPVSHSENELPWEPYRPEYLEELVQGNTVLVDFTADW